MNTALAGVSWRTAVCLCVLLAGSAWGDPRPEFADAAYRAQQPLPGKATQLRLPKVTRFTLANGLDVLLVTRKTLPTVQMELEFPGGARLDAAGGAGQTALCVALAGESTQRLEHAALGEAIADVAAHLTTWSNREQMGISLAVLKRGWPQALGLWADLLLRPGMRAEDLQRLTAQRLAALSQQKASVGGIAGRLQALAAWGRGHPLGRVTTERSLAGVGPEACAALWRERALPGNARLYVVGDVTRPELVAALTPLMAGWSGRPPPLPPLPEGQFVAHRVWLVDVPGSPQASILLAHPGPARTDPRFAEVSLLAAVLGGGFSSRINMNLRERHGWAYGARGGFEFVSRGSAWTVQSSVRTDAGGPAIAEIIKEMQLMQTELVSSEELDRERDGFIGALPAKWVTGAAIATGLANLQFHGLPLDDDLQMAKRWREVTRDGVRAVAGTVVQPQNASVLVVGDASKLAPQLLALTAVDGPFAGVAITRLDADGGELP